MLAADDDDDDDDDECYECLHHKRAALKLSIALELWTMSLFRFEGALIGFGSLSSGAPVLAVQSFGRRGEFVNVREEARERRGWSLDLPSSFSSCWERWNPDVPAPCTSACCPEWRFTGDWVISGIGPPGVRPLP
ncbi:uncharacterized [Tachysurus ichikawai]